MFGRLSEKKKRNAVDFMVETAEEISRTLIIWATNELKTPTKPFIDEIYFICAVLLSNNYLVWRNMTSDAHTDVAGFIDVMFTHVFEEHRLKFRFRSGQQNLHDFLCEIHARLDEHSLVIGAALRAEVDNIAAELERYRREDGASDDPHIQYMHALTKADHPFRDAIIRSFFRIDPGDEKASADYGYFASQASSLLIRYDEVFRQSLKSL